MKSKITERGLTSSIWVKSAPKLTRGKQFFLLILLDDGELKNRVECSISLFIADISRRTFLNKNFICCKNKDYFITYWCYLTAKKCIDENEQAVMEKPMANNRKNYMTHINLSWNSSNESCPVRVEVRAATAGTLLRRSSLVDRCPNPLSDISDLVSPCSTLKAYPQLSYTRLSVKKHTS